MRTGIPWLLRVLGIVAIGMFAFASPALADDDDNEQEYGAYINEGTCDDIGDQVVADVGDLDEDDDAWDVLGQGDSQPGMVYAEDEGIDPSIDDLTGSDHVVVIRATDDEDADVIACGEITGSTDSNGKLMITLDEVNDSGIQGRALFEPKQDSDDDEQTEVTTGVWQATGGTPVSSPESTAAA